MKLRGLHFTVAYLLLLVLTLPSFVTAQVVPVQPENDFEPALSILTPLVREAVRSSQGYLVARIPFFNGDGLSYEFSGANGVLVFDNFHVLSVAHIAGKYPAIASDDKTGFFFNDVPAKLVYTTPNNDLDLALFELKNPTLKMKPAKIADSVKFGDVYTGVSFYDNFALYLKMELIGAMKSKLFFNKPVQPGISGTPLWNDRGEIVGIIGGTTQAFALATRFEVIKTFLEKARKNMEEKKEKAANK